MSKPETNSSSQITLAVVMPVYNEADCITEVVDSWMIALNKLQITYKIIVLNDGSTDETATVLSAFESNDSVSIINKKNSGHGPTILQGYAIACQQAQWAFQIDSDNEMLPEHFENLWSSRKDHDFLIGIRTNRESPLPRKIITAVSRLTISMFFKRGVTDVNSPYRLIRCELLSDLLKVIPQSAFAPNVIISGLAAKWKARIYQCPVPHQQRQTGTVSIMKWKLWKSAMTAFFQTVKVAFSAKRPAGADNK